MIRAFLHLWLYNGWCGTLQRVLYLCALPLTQVQAISVFQDTLPLRLERAVNVPALSDFSLDAAGFLYTLTDDGTVEKYDTHGKRRSSFSQNQLGMATTLNTTNPLKILVWYADFKTVIYLDRNLAQLGGQLNLNDQGYPEVRTVAPAADGHLWLYDEVAFKLRKINAQGESLLESQHLGQLHGERIQIHQLLDDGNRVVATDTTQGFFIFDVFGQFLKFIPVKGIEIPVSINGKVISWLSGDHDLQVLNPDFPMETQHWTLPEQLQKAPFKRLYSGGVAAGTEGSVEIWRMADK